MIFDRLGVGTGEGGRGYEFQMGAAWGQIRWVGDS